MMQFGGKKSDFPQLWGAIPGRPYLPVDDDANLQSEAEEAIPDPISVYLIGAAEGARNI